MSGVLAGKVDLKELRCQFDYRSVCRQRLMLPSNGNVAKQVSTIIIKLVVIKQALKVYYYSAYHIMTHIRRLAGEVLFFGGQPVAHARNSTSVFLLNL